MSQTITTAFVNQWGDVVHMLAEQKMSRLRPVVQSKGITGEAWTAERIAGMEVQEITNRFADMPVNEINHSRRWGYVHAYDGNVLLDRWDKVRYLVSFESPYTKRLAGGIGRQIDRTVIGALDGPAIEGKTGTTTTPFPATQQVVSTDSSANPAPLSLATLLDSKERFLTEEAHDAPNDGVVVLINPNDWRALMDDDRLTNADYNTLRVLESGNPAGLMGMTFIMSNLIPDISDPAYDSGTLANRAFMFRRDAIEFGLAAEPNVAIDVRPDLRARPWQAYIWGAFGALRVEDVRVVRIVSQKRA